MIANKNEFGGSQFYHPKPIVSPSGLYFIVSTQGRLEHRRERKQLREVLGWLWHRRDSGQRVAGKPDPAGRPGLRCALSHRIP